MDGLAEGCPEGKQDKWMDERHEEPEPTTENLCEDDRGLRSHTTDAAQLPTAC